MAAFCLLVTWKKETFIVIPEVLAGLSADRQSPGWWVVSAHGWRG